MDRSSFSSSNSMPVSHVSSNDSDEYINHSSPYIIASAHHRHGCCNGRHHCDGSKCPNAPVLNPAIGIPLAICTGGLSAAAMGMYKGVRDHKYRKKMEKAYRQENRQLPPSTEYITPSTIPSTLEKAGRLSSISSAAELQGSPPGVQASSLPEKMDDATPPMSNLSSLHEKAGSGDSRSSFVAEKMDDADDDLPSELDSTPIETLPRYSELSPR